MLKCPVHSSEKSTENVVNIYKLCLRKCFDGAENVKFYSALEMCKYMYKYWVFK